VPQLTSADEKACPCGPATATGPQGRWLCAFVLLVALTVDFSTDTPYVPGRWLGPFYHLWPASQLTSAAGAVVLCLLAVLPLVGTWRPAHASAWPGGVASVPLRLLPVPAMLFAALWSLPHVARALVIPWYLLIAAAALFFVLGAARGFSPVRIAGAAALMGIAIRLIHFSRFPIEVGGDMLPLTRSALASLLAGRSPYVYYQLPEPLPLTYYPLTWLAYLPPHLLHIDLRAVNIVAELAIAAALLYVGRSPAERPAGPRLDWAGAALLLWSFVFLLPSSIFFDRITTAPVAWALLAWTVAAAARGSRWDWLLLGLLGAATPLAALPALFLLLTWWRRLPWRPALGRVAAAAAVALLLILPFYLWSPRGFLEGAVLWFNDLDRFPGMKWRAYQTWQRYVGFGGLFWRAGWQGWLAVIQWLLVGGLGVLYLRRGSDRRLVARYLASAFVAFMVFNSVHWPYVYQPALWCGMVALATTVPASAT
jgi:hypothetical protein